MSDDKAWEGLDERELRQIELLFCPPIFRVQLHEAPVNEPFARCGYMLGKILDRVEYMNVHRSVETRRMVPRNKDIAELLEDQPPFVSRLLKGRVGNQKPDREVWNKGRKVFRYLTLGTVSARAGDSPSEERTELANRMASYFFGDEQCVVGPYFSSDALGVPQSEQEGAYHLLWIGMEALKGTCMPQLTLASGGPAYPFSRNGSLTLLGRSAFCAVACGVKFLFVYPKLSEGTAASETAEEFIRLVEERRRSGKDLQLLKAMADICLKELPPCDAVAIRANAKTIPLSMTNGNQKTASAATWPGQFLTAGARFTRIPFGQQDRILAVRSNYQGKFAFELDDAETAAFRLWEKTFVFVRDGKKQ